MEFFDSHAHYNDEKFSQDRKEILQEVYQVNITKLVNAGYSVESSKEAVEIANQYPFVYATVGISPNDVPDTLEELEEQIKQIEKLAKEDKVVAIGEIGLDYYWNTENKEIQKEAFIRQIQLANRLQKPIVIHTREAVSDTLDILKNKSEVIHKGVFHCCPFNRELVKEGLKLGFYISFAGPTTFKNSKHAEEIANLVGLDRMLIETDSPYLSPEPYRGTRNDSRKVKLVADKIATFRGITIEEVAKATYENAKNIFHIE